MLSAAEERPWLWVVYVLTVALPLVLIIVFCCTGKRSSGSAQGQLSLTSLQDEFNEAGRHHVSSSSSSSSSGLVTVTATAVRVAVSMSVLLPGACPVSLWFCSVERSGRSKKKSPASPAEYKKTDAPQPDVKEEDEEEEEEEKLEDDVLRRSPRNRKVRRD
ncbi:hypothetical protein INR49_022666 [Caranx melampygus]|nr:hypothetical protein INR49_022666 [Caranx melampygus]